LESRAPRPLPSFPTRRSSDLLILTDVDAVYADWGKPTQRPLSRITADEAERLDREGQFGEGSMAPKIRAAVDFVRRTGGRAVIRSEEHTSELQSRGHLVCRLL